MYFKRSPPQIKLYNPPEAVKQKNATIQKLRHKHGLLSEGNKKEILNDISSYSTPNRDIHLASVIKKGQ